MKFVKASEIKKNPYDISKYWLKAQSLLKPIGSEIVFLKTHNALISINNNHFTEENSYKPINKQSYWSNKVCNY